MNKGRHAREQIFNKGRLYWPRYPPESSESAPPPTSSSSTPPLKTSEWDVQMRRIHHLLLFHFISFSFSCLLIRSKAVRIRHDKAFKAKAFLAQRVSIISILGSSSAAARLFSVAKNQTIDTAGRDSVTATLGNNVHSSQSPRGENGRRNDPFTRRNESMKLKQAIPLPNWPN